MIAKIDSRLRQAKCNMSKPFGGCSIILTGDPAQLLPVAASPLYNKNTKRVMQQLGLNAYQLFKNVVELKQIVRQQNINNCPKQKHFIELLGRLRNAESTIDDWKLLCERNPTPQLLHQFSDALRLNDLNEAVDICNKEKLLTINKPIPKINASNTGRAKNASPDMFSGLINSFFICVDSEVVLTSNIW